MNARIVFVPDIEIGFEEVVLYLSPDSPEVPDVPEGPVAPVAPVAPIDPVSPFSKVLSFCPTYWYATALIPPLTPCMKLIAELRPPAAAVWKADSLI